jgi:predicted metalloprotease with PDZ domain
VKNFILALVLCIFPSVAHSHSCQILEISPENHSLKIQLQLAKITPNSQIELRFLDRFAGIENLSQRVSTLRIKGENDQRLLPEILSNGQYRFVAKSSSIKINFEMRLSQLSGAARDPGNYALTSSLSREAGFLLLSDLLPEICIAGKCATNNLELSLQLPANWSAATTETFIDNAYAISDWRKASVFIGKLRKKIIPVNQMQVEVAIAGEHAIRDEEIFSLAQAVAAEQIKILGATSTKNYLVTIAPFPIPLTGLRSSALTRGRTVVMMLNTETNEKLALKHFQKHLAHEMFHFYLPESFNVRENFDWFWEGFTRYIALLTLHRLRMADLPVMLEEMSYEYQFYSYNPLRNKLSLVDLSPEKFANAASYELIYHKGTLVAWLYDLELRTQTEGRKNVLSVMRDLNQTYGNSQQEIGNREITEALAKAAKLDSFVNEYIKGTKEIDLNQLLKKYGLSVEGNTTKLSISPKWSKKQQTLIEGMSQ